MKIVSPLPHKRARLEIIPLIDIMFFLLAAFMMVSLTMSRQQTIKVSLPTATQARAEFKPDMINLAVDVRGEVFLEKQPITLPQLYAALTNRVAANPNIPIYISGDAETRHGAMINVLDLVRKAGAQKVAFNVKLAGEADRK
jgi:biopolymer transport protein ExbD